MSWRHMRYVKKNGNTASVNRTFQQSVHSVLLFIFNVTACAAKKKKTQAHAVHL